MMSRVRNQHTTPNCYLKTFGDTFWVYDKENKCWSEKKIHRKKISVIYDWYEHPDYEVNEVENFLGGVENDWARKGRDFLLSHLTNDSYILSEEDKLITAKFIWIQMSRTQCAFQIIEEGIGNFNNFLYNNGALNDEDFPDYKKLSLDLLIRDFDEGVEKLIDLFNWEVLKTSDSMHRFIISDNPILKIGSGHLSSNYIQNSTIL